MVHPSVKLSSIIISKNVLTDEKQALSCGFGPVHLWESEAKVPMATSEGACVRRNTQKQVEMPGIRKREEGI